MDEGTCGSPMKPPEEKRGEKKEKEGTLLHSLI
jgi:hypothetical protein